MTTTSKPNIEGVFHKINKFVSLKDDERNESTKNFNLIVKHILSKMCEKDPVFKSISNGQKLAGSYADQLKVSHADEYDLLVHIKLPCRNLVKIEPDPQHPGNVKINMTDTLAEYFRINNMVYYKHFHDMVDENKYLLQQKFQSWIESIITRIEVNGVVQLDGKSFDLYYRKSGPAHTCYVKAKPLNFSIDFVPALVFPIEPSQAARVSEISSIRTENVYWEAVPKTIRGVERNISWQTSYAELERKIILGKNNLKNTLRLLKKLRDTQNWQSFKSFHIKTIFLWECDSCSNGANFWNLPVKTLIFLMLERWIKYLEEDKLPFFWNPNCDLLKNFNEKQKTTLKGQVSRIFVNMRKYADSNPELILTLFLTKNELDQISSTSQSTETNDDREKAQTAFQSTETGESTESNKGWLDTLFNMLRLW